MFVLTNGQIEFCLVLFTMSRYPGEFMTNLHVLQEHLLIFQNNLIVIFLKKSVENLPVEKFECVVLFPVWKDLFVISTNAKYFINVH